MYMCMYIHVYMYMCMYIHVHVICIILCKYSVYKMLYMMLSGGNNDTIVVFICTLHNLVSPVLV